MDALAAILEWADREHCSILDDNRIDKMQKRLAAHTAA